MTYAFGDALTTPPATETNTDWVRFTPSLSFGGASVGITYSVQWGRYKIIGNGLCVIEAQITLTSKGSSTGNAKLGGLPFAPSADYGIAGMGAAVNSYSGLSGLTGALLLSVDSSGRTASFVQTGATATAAVSNTNFGNSSVVQAQFMYAIS